MWISALDLVYLIAITEHYECWDARNTVGGGDFLLLLRVDLNEGDNAWLGQLSRELLVDWGDSFAWSAPVGVDCKRRTSVGGLIEVLPSPILPRDRGRDVGGMRPSDAAHFFGGVFGAYSLQ